MTRRALLAAAAAAAAGCAGLRPVEGPAGARLHGLTFGRERGEVTRELAAAGVPARLDAEDPDLLHADRCPGAPVDGPCRLRFGPAGLWASEVLVPADGEKDLARLVEALSRAWGPADRDPDPSPGFGGPHLIARWQAPGWTLSLSGLAGLGVVHVRAEWDQAAPPTAAGLRLGARREVVEAILGRLGAERVDRDDATTTYLGCPDGAPDATTCVLEFRGGRLAAVVEGFGRIADDREALAAWRARTAGLEREMGRPPALACPDQGPDRVGGPCTSTWAGSRLAVTVGASRNAGGRHRGDVSLWISWAWPPLQAVAPGPPEPGTAPAGPAAGQDSSK